MRSINEVISSDLPPLHLLKFSSVVALEVASAYLPAKMLDDLDQEELSYLRAIVATLDHNPLAIRLAMGSARIGEKLRDLFQNLHLPALQGPFIKSMASTRLARIVSFCWKSFQLPERLIFLSLGQARLRVKKDPKDLIAALLYADLLETDADYIENRNYSNMVNSVMSNKKFAKQVIAEDGREIYLDIYLTHNPYKREFAKVIACLTDFGLALSNREGYWDLHPLLPYSIAASVGVSCKKLYERCILAFSSSYRVESLHWKTISVVPLWVTRPNPSPVPGSWRSRVLIDFSNCTTAVRAHLNQDVKSWRTGFPWRLLTGLGIQYCSIFGADVVAYERTIVADLMVDFLRKWKKAGLTFARRYGEGSTYYKEHVHGKPKENGGAEQGRLTTVLVAVCLAKYWCSSLDKSPVIDPWGEVDQHWRRFLEFPGILNELETVPLIAAICYLRGFTSLGSSSLELSHSQNRAYLAGLSPTHLAMVRPDAHFDAGLAEAHEVASYFSAYTQDDLDRLEVSESGSLDTENNDDPVDTDINFSSNDEIVADSINLGLQDSNVNSSADRVARMLDRSYMDSGNRRHATHSMLDTSLVQHLSEHYMNGDQNGVLASHVALGQRMMLRKQWQDALEQYLKIESVLLQRQPALSDPKAARLSRDGFYLATQLALKAQVLTRLGRTSEAETTYGRIRETMSFNGNNSLQRGALLLAYLGLADLNYYRPKPGQESLDEDQMSALIEYGCLLWDKSLTFIADTTQLVTRQIRTAEPDFQFEPSKPDGNIFMKIFLHVAFKRNENTADRSPDSPYQIRPELSIFLRLCRKMMRADSGRIKDLLAKVLSLLLWHSVQPETSETPIEEICFEAEAVLFGSAEACRNLVFLGDDFRGKVRCFLECIAGEIS